MRIESQKQLSFKVQASNNEYNEELKTAVDILNGLSNYKEILALIRKDLLSKGEDTVAVGRIGMTAEQVLICAIAKSQKQLSYRELAERTIDSISLRGLLELGILDKGFSYKTLQKNIKGIREETLDEINRQIKQYAYENKIEDGKKTRTDGTVISANIHHPTDWAQIHDCIRVLTRMMTASLKNENVEISFSNHFRASKKKLFIINNTHSQNEKHKTCVEMIRLCKKTIADAKASQNAIASTSIGAEFAKYIGLAEQVYNVAYRRIIKSESVPANEKIVSIFESHVDIIVKGLREVLFGHKATITTGRSGLILDVQIHDKNPADSTLVSGVLQRHKDFYKNPPKSMVFDGCYFSGNNAELLNNHEIEFSFCKGANAHSTKNKKIIKKLRFFRSGIEATISLLKRKFGWNRILDKTKQGFHNAAKRAVIAYNVCTLVKLQLCQ